MWVVIVVIAALAVGAIVLTVTRSPEPTVTPEASPAANLPNPASVYCESHGGRSEIRTAADGSQSGACMFADNTECDEWAFFRGNCNLGIAPTTPPVNWKTYHNTKYGFRVSYPSDWKVSESSPGAVVISVTDGGIRFLGVEVSPPYTTATDELSALAVQFGAQIEPITINGISGIRRNDEGGGITYYLEHGGTYVEIMTNKEQMDAYEDVGKVIATFAFE